MNDKSTVIAAAFLILLAAYLACGLLFAFPFVLFGVKRIDPHARHSSRGFRLLIIPGVMAFWPLLLRRWAGGATAPPEERNAHRSLVRNFGTERESSLGELKATVSTASPTRSSKERA